MASVASHDFRKQLSSITECSVCFDTFSDPRQPPCIHTYCLECVRGFAGDKQPGENVPCPLCRTVFKIPERGIGGLPNNFFVEQLKDFLRPTSTHCNVCSGDETDVALKKVATMFCVECSERQCEACATTHSHMKVSRDHNLIKLDEEESAPAVVAKLVKLYCKVHKNKPLELYCFDCKAAICMLCFIKTHKLHCWMSMKLQMDLEMR
jgi:B-box zinc finger/RING-type zinc-finger